LREKYRTPAYFDRLLMELKSGTVMPWIQNVLRRYRKGREKADLTPGTLAPDFSLASTAGAEISLRQLRGRPVILAFYPADWSVVCGAQMALYNEILDMFAEYDAQLLGISVDGLWSHRAYAESLKLRFPLLSDFEPKAAVARLYGVYRESEGTSERALFVLDEKGVIRWRYVSQSDVNPGADGILKALEQIRHEQEASK
jgi:peroxiredoxin